MARQETVRRLYQSNYNLDASFLVCASPISNHMSRQDVPDLELVLAQ